MFCCKNHGLSILIAESAGINIILSTNCVPGLIPTPEGGGAQDLGLYTWALPRQLSLYPCVVQFSLKRGDLLCLPRRQKTPVPEKNLKIAATKCLFSPWRFSLPSRSKFISVTTATGNCRLLPANSFLAPLLRSIDHLVSKRFPYLSLLFHILRLLLTGTVRVCVFLFLRLHTFQRKFTLRP